jgi:AcrR family transcriptional regulator
VAEQGAVPVGGARGPASRLGLSRERILDGALALLDREGLDAFTMRRVAAELGVGTMTIYGYFRGKDELLDAVIDAGAKHVSIPETRGPWRARLRQLILGIRQSLIEHPAVVELRLRRPLVSPGALQLTEIGMRILRDAGFSKREAARAFRTLFLYTFGFSALAPGKRLEAEREQGFRALSALPADRYPVLAESAREAADSMADRTLFEFGLDCLIDGLEQSLEVAGTPSDLSQQDAGR